MTIDKHYSPADIESRWYPHWESSGAFRPARPDAEPFTIVIPPPNVTGSLHMGHALDNTLQDVLIRYHRLKGRDALWVVGTDHAGIATQMVVERQLAESNQGTTRQAMGREAFVKTVWDWKRTSGSTITNQLRRLGASCDWSNERFTMDEGFNTAVTKVFVKLYREGLLYKDKRLVNWDPKLMTAISDLEVEQREVKGHFWHFRYPLEDGSGFIAIATTRPETILGDGAVAVHPDDARYRHLVGKRCRLPIVDRLIPIIADEHVKMDFGSGAVKITAAHDHNDYAVAKRHPEANIPVINLMNLDATMNENTPPEYRGLDRYAAREKVVAAFDTLGLLDKVEDHTHMVPYGDRSGVVIEPLLTDQWYVDAETLAKPAIEAVRSGSTKFVPANWDKTYFNWMDNIQPWCVSRQLWWGHRIPAWYGPVEAFGSLLMTNPKHSILPSRPNEFVAESEAEAITQAQQFYPDFQSGRFRYIKAFDTQADAIEASMADGYLLPIWRDEDVLDTWFSSALWPFGTLGWPADSEALKRHYPGSVLVTGFDIIFFWVARMMMQGIHFMDGVPPFATVYCHGLVRDAKGAKMSKSKGNTVDPLLIIDKYGADALRFTLTAMESQGRDIKLEEKRVEGYRNFGTKLWNAARFAQSNGIGASASVTPPAATLAVNRWIIGEVAKTAAALDQAIADFRFDAYADTIYQFVWSRFCDWYLELIKPLFAEDADATGAAETRDVAGWALDQILVMLHPVMPFITEELWHALGQRNGDLIGATWVAIPPAAVDAEAGPEIDWLIGVVSEIRAARAELNVPPGARLPLHMQEASIVTTGRLTGNLAALQRLARVAHVSHDPAPAGSAAQVVYGEAIYILPLEGVIDLAAERARLEKAAAAAEKERDALTGRLGNPGFVEKARPEAVEKARTDLLDRTSEAERLRAALGRLK